MTGLAGEFAAIVELWWKYVFHATWTSSLVALILLAIVRLGRRWPSQLRYGLLLLILIKFATPPMLELPMGLFSRLGPEIGWQDPSAESEENHTLTGQVSQAQSDETGINWPLMAKAALMLVHLAGCLFIATAIVRQWLRVRQVVRKGRRLRYGPIHARMRQLAGTLRLRRKVKLLQSAGNIPPMAFGVIKPVIILPASSMSDLPDDELDAVIAHELAHHLRGDLWSNLLLAALGALWWFNPILWIVNRRFREACENCCDDLLIARGITNDQTYCSALLKIASSLPDTLQLNAAFGFAARIHPLTVRIGRIMDTSTKRLTRLPFTSMGVILLIAGLALPGLPSHTPNESEMQNISQVEPPPPETASSANEISPEIPGSRDKNPYAQEPNAIPSAAGAGYNITVPQPNVSTAQTAAPKNSLKTQYLLHPGYSRNQTAGLYRPKQFSTNTAPKASSPQVSVRQVSLQSPMIINQHDTATVNRNWQHQSVSHATPNPSSPQPSQRFKPASNSQQAEAGLLSKPIFNTGETSLTPTATPEKEQATKNTENHDLRKTRFIAETSIKSEPEKPQADSPSIMSLPSIPVKETKPKTQKTPFAGDDEVPDFDFDWIFQLDNATSSGDVIANGHVCASDGTSIASVIFADLENALTGNLLFDDTLLDGIEPLPESMDTGIIPLMNYDKNDILPPWVIEAMNNYDIGHMDYLPNQNIILTPDPVCLLPLSIGGLLLLRHRRRQSRAQF